jgi:cystathionine beta-lyase
MVPNPNLFGYTALEAAYGHGDEWLEQVLEYLQKNLDYIRKFLGNNIPKIKMIEPQGTYLLWLDCRDLGMEPHALQKFMIEDAKVGMEDGYIFGEAGRGFMRMNIATQMSVLIKALNRIKTAYDQIS